MSNLRNRIDRIEPRLSPATLPRVVRVVTYARDPATWDLVHQAEAGARVDGWAGPVMVIDRRIVHSSRVAL